MPRKSNKPRSYKKRPVANKKYNRPRSYNKSKKSDGPMARIGSSLGSYFGNTGSKVGRYLGKAVGVITGSGEYRINKNSLIHGDQVPYVHSSNEVVRIRHREFLGNLNGSVLFNSISYNINPGLKTTFPWLYSTAISFEQYKIEGMIIEFVSTCGDAIASTNNTLGTICLAADYNVVNDDFINMSQCQNAMWSSTSKPSRNITMPIECDGKLNVLERLFIRTNETSLSNSDLRLYDHCKFTIATEGMQIATQIGQLWITYEISFYKPVLTNALEQKTAHIYTGAYDNGFFMNRVEKTNSLNVYFVSGQTNRVYFPKSTVGKTYMLYYVMYNTVTSYNWNEFNYTFFNLSAVNNLVNSTSNQLDIPFSAGAITSITSGPSLLVCFKVDVADAYFQISGGVNTANATQKGELLIWQYN